MRALRAGAALALAAALAAAAAPSPGMPPPGPFDPGGRWRFFHSDGTPFLARLLADQTATTDYGADGERGIWRWDGGAVRMIYTDGWDDMLSREPDGSFRKRAWAPGGDRCAPPANDARAERVSAEPGPPLR